MIQEQYLGYKLEKADGRQPTTGGGMPVKMARLEKIFGDEFPGVRYISRIGDVQSRHLVVESMFGYHHSIVGDEWGSLLEMMRSKHTVLACYEHAIARMSDSKARALCGSASVVTANCKFMQSLLGYKGVINSILVSEPIPDEFFDKSGDREPSVVAMGNVSWFKHSDRVARIYKLLEGSGIKRVYIGSAGFWRNDDPLNAQIESDLYEHCDEVKANVTQQEVVDTLHACSVGLWVSIFDVFATCAWEMLAAGLPLVGCRHGLSDELPIEAYDTAEEQAEAIKRLVRQDDLDEKRVEVSDWTHDFCSVDSFVKQTKEALKIASTT